MYKKKKQFSALICWDYQDSRPSTLMSTAGPAFWSGLDLDYKCQKNQATHSYTLLSKQLSVIPFNKLRKSLPAHSTPSALLSVIHEIEVMLELHILRQML